MFYDKFLDLCQAKGVTPTQAGRENGIAQPTISMWKKRGTTPKTGTLMGLSHYFDVPMDYLAGKEKKAGERIADLVQQHKMSFAEIAAGTGIPSAKLYDIFQGKHISVTVEEQKKIAEVLGEEGSLSSLLFNGEGVDLSLLAINLQKKYNLTFSVAESIVNDCCSAFQGEFRTEDEAKIGKSLWLLNSAGVCEAISRVEELTEISKYQAKTPEPLENAIQVKEIDQ